MHMCMKHSSVTYMNVSMLTHSYAAILEYSLSFVRSLVIYSHVNYSIITLLVGEKLCRVNN